MTRRPTLRIPNTAAAARRWRETGSRERGTVLSVLLAVSIPLFIIILGIAIDFTGHTAAEQQARFVATQAARSAGQQVQSGSGTTDLRINTATAVRAARSYLASSSYEGTVELIDGGRQISVTITGASYPTKFLSVIGINQLPIRAQGLAAPVRAVDGTER